MLRQIKALAHLLNLRFSKVLHWSLVTNVKTAVTSITQTLNSLYNYICQNFSFKSSSPKAVYEVIKKK